MAQDVRKTMSDNDTKIMRTQGKRTLVYRWDDANCKLNARYYRIGGFAIAMKEFESAPMIPGPQASFGAMHQVGETMFYGKGFIGEVGEVLAIHQEESDEDRQWDEVMKLAEKYGLIRQAYGGVAVLAHQTVEFPGAVKNAAKKVGATR